MPATPTVLDDLDLSADAAADSPTDGQPTAPLPRFTDTEQAFIRIIDGTAEVADFEWVATMIPDRQKRIAEENRVRRVLNALPHAGNAEQFLALQAETAGIVDRNNAKRAALQEEAAEVLRRIELQVRELDAETIAAERRVKTMGDARKTLRENAPEGTKAAYNAKVSAVRATADAAELRRVEAEARGIEQFLTSLAKDRNVALEGLRASVSNPDHWAYDPNYAGLKGGEKMGYLGTLSDRVNRMQPELERKLSAMKRRVAEGRAINDDTFERLAVEVLDVYTPSA